MFEVYVLTDRQTGLPIQYAGVVDDNNFGTVQLEHLISYGFSIRFVLLAAGSAL